MEKLVLDFVYAWEICNFRCRYCSSRKNAAGLDGTARRLLWTNLDRALASLKDRFLIYRFSGGEIFLAEEILRELLNRTFPLTQFLTNGSILSEKTVKELADARDRVAVGLSLDGHTTAMNRLREGPSGMSQSTLKRILENLSRLVAARVPVEIQTVLSEANARDFSGFLEFLLERFSGACLLVSPFPVRPLAARVDTTDLRWTLSRYDRYASLLPSRDYMEGLVRCLERGRRDPCCVPEHVTFRVLRNGATPSPRLVRYFCECGGLRFTYGPECASCYTHYDLLNSLIAGRTDPDEVDFPLYKHQKVRAYLREARARPRRWSRGGRRLFDFARACLLGNRI